MPHSQAEPALTASDPHATARVLTAAATTAQRTWHRERCDIYHCLSRAWRATAMPTSYAALTEAVREHLRRTHPGTSIMEFSDAPNRTAAEIAELLAATARDCAHNQPAPRPHILLATAS
ncbi:hypothetical protein [Mycolicibacterium sp.]|uniref:DUF6197 family protein n=1 Tax=Mycolicibacterium sp. TaxID=2320850 RepID=UPI0037C62630